MLPVLRRSYTLTRGVKQPKVCIIGSGPAGFYLAQHIFKALPEVSVDMYERLPVPFGLVRYGVAPDHPEVKNVIHTFEKTAAHKNFNFLGNVTLGRDIYFKELKEAYHAIALTYGCSLERKLGIRGEEGILPARRLVGWYNGLPEDRDLRVDLSRAESVAVIGQGNVAIDVARILLAPLDYLKNTDITSYALEALSASRVKRVYLIGRRGPLHVAFTIKEFREMTKLPQVATRFESGALQGLEPLLTNLARPRRRLTELLLKTATAEPRELEREFRPLFYRKPLEYANGGLLCQRTAVKDNLKGLVVETDEVDRVPAELAVASVGYRGVATDPDIPFNQERGVVTPTAGVYASGWISTGPVGVILTTMNNAFQEAARLVADIKSNKIQLSEDKPGFQHIKNLLQQRGVVSVSWRGWKQIDRVEVKRGVALNKTREKVVDLKEMLEIAAAGGEEKS